MEEPRGADVGTRGRPERTGSCVCRKATASLRAVRLPLVVPSRPLVCCVVSRLPSSALLLPSDSRAAAALSELRRLAQRRTKGERGGRGGEDGGPTRLPESCRLHGLRGCGSSVLRRQRARLLCLCSVAARHLENGCRCPIALVLKCDSGHSRCFFFTNQASIQQFNQLSFKENSYGGCFFCIFLACCPCAVAALSWQCLIWIEFPRG